MVVPLGTTTGVATCDGSLSRIFQPETFTGDAVRFLSSTQSATWSPFDSTSLMTTAGGLLAVAGVGRAERVGHDAEVPGAIRAAAPVRCVRVGRERRGVEQVGEVRLV